MIKFFRKIRKKLLSDNKFSKYLIYAIGEIVLVVIGIIIALQINIWNESRKEQNAELLLFSNILDDLNSENYTIETQIKFANSFDELHTYVYNESIGKAEYNPNNKYNYLLWFQRYKMFMTEKYSESLASITNDKIHSALKSYIKNENDVKTALDEWNEHQLQIVRPFLTQHGINNTDTMFNNEYNEFAEIINRLDLIDHSKLMEQYGSEEFDQLLFNMRFKTLWMAQNFEWLLGNNRRFRLVLSNELSSTKLESSYEPIEPETISELFIIGKTTDEIIEIIANEIKKKKVFNFSYSEVNQLGYDLLGNKNLEDALTVFKLNIELYPDDWNVYDSYGEGLLEFGDIENGIKAYKKSLELNPDNATAKDIIEKYSKEN